jgi:hypothetical protein
MAHRKRLDSGGLASKLGLKIRDPPQPIGRGAAFVSLGLFSLRACPQNGAIACVMGRNVEELIGELASIYHAFRADLPRPGLEHGAKFAGVATHRRAQLQ